MRVSSSVVFAFAACTSIAVVSAAHAQHPTQAGGVFCMSDINQDLAVDGADLGMFLLAWDSTDTQADFNFDGLLVVLTSAYCSSSGGPHVTLFIPTSRFLLRMALSWSPVMAYPITRWETFRANVTIRIRSWR